MKKAIVTDRAPAAMGPYSQGIETGNLVFVSGQIPINLRTGEMESADIAAATRYSLENVSGILAGAGLTMEHIVKATIFLADIADFAAVNEVYASFFTGAPPARSCFQVAALPKGARVEIEAIAAR